MSDFATTLANAFKAVFPDAERTKCFFHMKQNIIKRYTKKKCESLLEYVDSMGSCITYSELDSLWRIIKKDLLSNTNLKELSQDFIPYFQNEYMTEENKGFIIGSLPPGYSNTNNMLEGHHRHLKHNIFEKKVRSIGIDIHFCPYNIILTNKYKSFLQCFHQS